MAGLPDLQNAVLAGLWDGARGVGGPFDPARRPPAWLRVTLGQHPRWFINLLDRRLPWRGNAA